MTRYSRIAGTGSYLPEKVLTNADLEKMVETSDEWIRSRSGIESRHIAVAGETTTDLAEPAARRAMEAAGVGPADIDLICVGTTTPDLVFPNVGTLLQQRLGIHNCAAFSLEAACSGFIYALGVADKFIRLGDARCALVGDAPGNTMASLIEDVFGGIAHIMEHATKYGGDATRIGVTGDSAGGHLSAAVSLMPDMIGSRGFGRTPGVFEFMPSYLPAGKTVDEVRSEMLKAIKAAAPSYGVFSAANLNVYSEANANDQAWKQAIAPLSHIPDAKARAVPQFLTRGTRDTLISNAMVTEFTDALVTAGQRVEYIQVGGAGHAFFDWKPDETTKATFARYGVYYAAAMRGFFESTLY